MSDQEIGTSKRGARLRRSTPPTAPRRTQGPADGDPGQTIKGYSLGRTSRAAMPPTNEEAALQDLKYFRDSIEFRSATITRQEPYLPPYYHPGPEARDPLHAGAPARRWRIPAGAAHKSKC